MKATPSPAVEPLDPMVSVVIAGPPVVVRDAAPDDCDAIASIYNEAIQSGTGTMDTRPFTSNDFRATLEHLGPRERLLCAEDASGATVGFAKLKRYSDREGYAVACETSVYVFAAQARRGLGSRLQEALLDEATSLGYHHVCARILSVNEGSLAFHRRFGFEVVGRQRRIGRIRGVWHDVTLMQRILPATEEETGSLWGRSLARLVGALEQRSDLTPAQAREELLGARIDVADLWPYANVDHPVRESYGRSLVFEGSSFEVMVMSWAPGDCSAIHDHGAATWGAVQVFGPAEHGVFRLDRGSLRTVSTERLLPGEVLPVDHDLLHQMSNPSSEPFVSLHVYGTTARGLRATAQARIFDLDEESIQRTDGGVFFCLSESEIIRREPGPSGDRETALRHHRQMAARIRRVLSGDEDAHLAARLARLEDAIARLAGKEKK